MKSRSSMEIAHRQEIERALRQLRCGEDPTRILDELSRRLTNKLLHAPTRALHEADGETLAHLQRLSSMVPA